MSQQFIGWADGWLCVCWRDNDFNAPNRQTVYWPAVECSEERARPLLGLEALKESGPAVSDGCYLVKLTDGEGFNGPQGNAADRIGLGFSAQSGGPFSNWYARVRLRDGERTVNIRCDSEPLPCPKVRKSMETRYRNGRWEKYLKTSGWVAA